MNKQKRSVGRIAVVLNYEIARVGGYMVRWGYPDGDQFFTKDTYLGIERYEKLPLVVAQNYPGVKNRERVGTIDVMRLDSKGLWCEGSLDLTWDFAYDTLQKVDMGECSWGAGALQGQQVVGEDGGIKSWPIVEALLWPVSSIEDIEAERKLREIAKEIAMRREGDVQGWYDSLKGWVDSNRERYPRLVDNTGLVLKEAAESAMEEAVDPMDVLPDVPDHGDSLVELPSEKSAAGAEGVYRRSTRPKPKGKPKQGIEVDRVTVQQRIRRLITRRKSKGD